MNQSFDDSRVAPFGGETRRHWERPPIWPSRDIGPRSDLNRCDQALSSTAQAILNLRARRLSVFGSQIAANFGDPSWDMFLELFIAHVAERRISPTDLCLTTNVSQSTALRHIAVMVEGGFVVREADAKDSRRIILSLSPAGLASMRELLGSMAGNSEGR